MLRLRQLFSPAWRRHNDNGSSGPVGEMDVVIVVGNRHYEIARSNASLDTIYLVAGKEIPK